MALGNNRDYKTNDRRVRNNLKRHFERTKELVAAGMKPEAASKQALEEILHGKAAKS